MSPKKKHRDSSFFFFRFVSKAAFKFRPWPMPRSVARCWVVFLEDGKPDKKSMETRWFDELVLEGIEKKHWVTMQ